MEDLMLIPYAPAAHKAQLETILKADPDFLEAFREDSGTHPNHIHVALLGGSVVGYLGFSGFHQSVFTTVYVAKNHRKKGVGTALLHLANSILVQQSKTELSIGSCPAEDRETLQFLYKNGYYTSYSSYLMERSGPILPHANIEVRHYEDSDYRLWHQITSMAFYNMRAGAGILPAYYSPPGEKARASLLANRQNNFVMLLGGEIVATGSIDGNELDSVAVHDSHQHKGYGKAFASYLINTIIKRGEKTVRLWVVNGNPAKHLYDSLGFQEISKHAFLVRYYQPDSRPSAPPAQ